MSCCAAQAFARQLAERLERLIADECREIAPLPAHGWRPWQRLRSTVIFHVLRRFPSWADRLPVHAPKLDVKAPATGVVGAIGGRQRHRRVKARMAS